MEFVERIHEALVRGTNTVIRPPTCSTRRCRGRSGRRGRADVDLVRDIRGIGSSRRRQRNPIDRRDRPLTWPSMLSSRRLLEPPGVEEEVPVDDVGQASLEAAHALLV